MFVISLSLGNRHYPIPYRWKRIASIFLAMGMAYALAGTVDRIFFKDASFSSSPGAMAGKLAANTLFILAYLVFAYLAVHRKNAAYLSGQQQDDQLGDDDAGKH